MRSLLPAIALALLLGWVTAVPTVAAPGDGSVERLQQGLIETITGWTERPAALQSGDNPGHKVTRGLARTIQRTSFGALNTATFFVPRPDPADSLSFSSRHLTF